MIESVVTIIAKWLYDNYATGLLKDVAGRLGIESLNRIKWKKATKKYLVNLQEQMSPTPIFRNPEKQINEIFSGVNIIDPQTKCQLEGFSAIDEFPRLWVWGGPGAGKTTYLQHIALQTIKEKLDQKLPIFVSMYDLSISGKAVLDFIVERFRICGFPDAQPFVIKLLMDGNGIVLFDGLDEIKTEKQENLIYQLNTFLDEFHDCKIVISCRTGALEYEGFKQLKYVNIAPFDDKQIFNFVRKYFSQPDQREKRHACVQAFNKKENQTLLEMARIPLVLSLLCYVFDSQGNFLESRVNLYEKVLEDYPVEWYAKSKFPGQNQTALELNQQQEQQLFAFIAYYAFEQGKTFLEKEELLSKITEYLVSISTAQKVDATTILKRIETRHGVLVRHTEDSYAFVHLTFQEYYAALYIAEEIIQDGLLPGIHRVNGTDETWILNQPYLTKVHELLITHYNESELKTLCFNLSIDYESLNAIGKADKVRELVRHCLRHNILPELKLEVRKQRPRIAWPESVQGNSLTQSRLSLMTHLYDPRWREVLLFVAEMLPQSASSLFFEQFLDTLQQLVSVDNTLVNILKWTDSKSNKVKNTKLAFPNLKEQPINAKPPALRSLYLHLNLELALHQSSLDLNKAGYDYFHFFTHQKSSHYSFIIGYSFIPKTDNSNDILFRFEKYFEPVMDTYLKEESINDRFFAILFFLQRTFSLWRDMSMPLEAYAGFATTFFETFHPLLAVDYLLNMLSVVLDILNQVPEAQFKGLLDDSTTSSLIKCLGELVVFSAVIGLPEYQSEPLFNAANPRYATYDAGWYLTLAQAIESTREYQDLNHQWKLSNEQVVRLNQYLKANWLLIECLNVADITDREAIENQMLLPPSIA